MPERVRPPEEAPKNGPGAADFRAFLARDMEIGAQIARLNASRGTNMARWENLGGDPDEIREGRKLDRDGLGRLKLQARVAGYMGYTVKIETEANGQTNFASALDPDAPPAEPSAPAMDEALECARADTDGWNTGWAGGALDHNPHTPGTLLHQHWDRACRDGIEAKAERDRAKGKAPAADTSKAKPARAADKPTPEPAAPRRARRAAPPAANATAVAAISAPTPDIKPGWQGDRDFTGPVEATTFPLEARPARTRRAPATRPEHPDQPNPAA
jgi:hypothetical protein